VYIETCISCLHCGALVEFQSFRLKTVPRVESKAAAFVATNVKETARAAPRVK
jgi:hypothetical protein